MELLSIHIIIFLFTDIRGSYMGAFTPEYFMLFIAQTKYNLVILSYNVIIIVQRKVSFIL